MLGIHISQNSLIATRDPLRKIGGFLFPTSLFTLIAPTSYFAKITSKLIVTNGNLIDFLWYIGKIIHNYNKHSLIRNNNNKGSFMKKNILIAVALIATAIATAIKIFFFIKLPLLLLFRINECLL